MSGLSFFCASPEDTQRAGRWLGRRLRPGDVVTVAGTLGAGKTTFIQGLVRGYGLTDVVTSPTFALIHEYGPPERRVVHVDPYRLETPEEMVSVGLEDYLSGCVVLVVEWPERLADLLPETRVTVLLEIRDDEARIVRVSGIPTTGR